MTASATAVDGFVLADHALVQLVFEVQQLLHLAFQQSGDGNAGPAAHHFGDVLLVHFLLDEAAFGAVGRGARGFLLQLAFEGHQLAVFQFGGAVEVVLALGVLDLDLDLLHLLAQLWSRSTDFFSSCQRAVRASEAAFCVGQLLFELGQPLFGCRVFLLAQGFALDLELHDAAARSRRVSAGMESISVRRRAAASSTRSMALSGRKRSVM